MKRWLIAAALLAAAVPASAFWQSRDSNYNQNIVAAGGGYTGPGDVVGSAAVYLSCTRAYTAAYAASNGNACDLVRASDSTTCTMVFQTDGNVDVSATNSCTGATETVTQFCNATTCRVSQTYDQSGNARHFTQTTDADRPTFDPAGAKVVVFAGSQALQHTTIGAIAQPYSISAVAKRTSGTATTCILCTSGNNADLALRGANVVSIIWNGAFQDAAQTDNSCHAFQAVGNGTSSSIMVDGTLTGPLSPGTGSLNNSYFVGAGAATGGTFPLTGTIRELIIYPSNITANQSALSTNQTGYGGC